MVSVSSKDNQRDHFQDVFLNKKQKPTNNITNFVFWIRGQDMSPMAIWLMIPDI